jgi:hypothetical protein
MDNQSSEPVGETWNLDPEYHKVSDFLGVNIYDRNDSELAKKVYALKDWAMETGNGKTITSALMQMRTLQRELGHQFIGKPLILEMYKTVRLNEAYKQERSLPEQPIKNQTVKPEVKAEKSKQIAKPAKAQDKEDAAISESVNSVVSKALGNKKTIQNAVLNAIKEAL